MKKLSVFSMALVASIATAGSAQAALIGDFRLDGTTANQAGGALTLSTAGELGSTGITFDQNEGTLISGFTGQNAYSLELRFSFDDVTGYRKIANIPGLGSDTGLYVQNGTLRFYPNSEASSAIFQAGVLASVVVTRNAAGDFRGYFNGAEVLALSNLGGTTLPNDLYLLRDDTVNGGEASSGFVDYIRVYDTALSASEVSALVAPGAVAGAIPEPATWAMFLLAFGAVGYVMRSRKFDYKLA